MSEKKSQFEREAEAEDMSFLAEFWDFLKHNKKWWLTPIGLAMRVFRYDPMSRALEPDRKSYWIERDPQPDPKQYFRQY